MSKTEKIKCTNVSPHESASRDDRSGVCPECGLFGRILSSGNFRTHNRVFPVGDPRIAENVASVSARAIEAHEHGTYIV